MAATNNTEAQTASSGRRGSPLTKFIDNITLGANSKMIYGEPVERDGVTVIPVGKVSWGMGFGEGGDVKGNGGSGGGGGLGVSPVGYIEIKNGMARFKPIFDPALIVQIILASAFVSLTVLTGIRGIIKIVRKK